MSDSRALAYLDTAPRLGDTFTSSVTVAFITAVIGAYLVWDAVWQPHHLLTSLVGFALLAGLINFHWAVKKTGQRFGEANQATLFRAGLVCLISSTLIAGGDPPAITWHLQVLIALALALDAVDGFIARRFKLCSAFGARFDMEIDALLLMVLSLLVWQSGQTGIWVLGIGLMRYIFVAASWIYPALKAPLAPSFRRKCVCALQGIALFTCLLPPLDQSEAVVVAALALVGLTGSFAIDIRTLLQSETALVHANNNKTS